MNLGPDISRDAAAPAAEADADAAWARVVAAWDDGSAHRVYVDGLRDLEALAEAGRRYRAALAARPGDPVALRALGDIVRRATVQGLASLPRSAPPRRLSPAVRRGLVALVGLALGALALAAASTLHTLLGARP